MTKRWKPKKGKPYWTIDTFAKVWRQTYSNDTYDSAFYSIGNCFSTENEAISAAEKFKALLLSLQEPIIDCNQLPKLTTEVFNRPDCPEWARYAAVDGNGIAHYYDEQPYPMDTFFYNSRAHHWSVEGYFDSSDWKNSLIERPAILPDWCKVDAIGWHKRCGYFKVTYIDDVAKRVDIQQVEDKSKGYLSFHTVCSEAMQARPRPYNEAEMKALAGKLITMPDGSIALCTAWAAHNNVIVLDSIKWRAAELFKRRFTIDGNPCGVLEHLNEKGEWTE